MTLFLPVAGLAINPLLLVTAGLLVGFLSGLLGVGGGFLLTPLLILMGLSPAVAAASGTNALVGTGASGLLAHLRQRNVDFRLGLVLLAGGVLGGAAGTSWVRALRQEGSLDAVIVGLYVLFLGALGLLLFSEGLLARVQTTAEEGERASAAPRWVSRIPFPVSFPASGIRVSPVVPLLLGALVGLLAAFMGVGGGFFLVPALTFLLGVPMRVVVGTSLFQVLFTALGVTVLQAWLNGTVDVVVALGILAGSAVGAQGGAAVSRKLQGKELQIVFSLLLLALSFRMLNDLLALPRFFLVPGGGHP
jgi:hypothetical protein